MGAIVDRIQVVGVSDQPDNNGLLEAPTSMPGFQRFIASGGTASTIICAALTGATANVYVGHYVRCRKSATGLNKDLRRRVIAFNPGTTTLTLDEDLPEAVGANDQFEGYVNPAAMAVEDTGGGAATDINDAVNRDEATNYWDNDKGDYALAVNGSITENTLRQVQSFTTAGGIVAVTAEPSVPAVGDLFDLLQFPEILGNVLFDTNQNDIERMIQLGGANAFDRVPNARGSQNWAATIPLEWKGSGSGAGAGVAGVRPADMWRLLDAIMTEIQSTGDTVVAPAGTTPALSVSHLAIANGNAGNWPVGSPMLHAASGRLATVISTAANGADPDSVNVQASLVRAPVAGDIMYAGNSYYPKLVGHRAVTFVEWDGSFKSYYMNGALQGLALRDFTRDRVPRLEFRYMGGEYHRIRKTTYPAPTRTLVRANAETNAYITLGATTVLRLISMDIDWGLSMKVWPILNGYDGGLFGFVMVDWDPTINVVAKYDGVSPHNTHRELDRYQNGETFSLQAQHNELPGYTTGAYAHVCEWKSPKINAQDNLRHIAFTARPLLTSVTGLPKLLLQTA